MKPRVGLARAARSEAGTARPSAEFSSRLAAGLRRIGEERKQSEAPARRLEARYRRGAERKRTETKRSKLSAAATCPPHLRGHTTPESSKLRLQVAKSWAVPSPPGHSPDGKATPSRCSNFRARVRAGARASELQRHGKWQWAAKKARSSMHRSPAAGHPEQITPQDVDSASESLELHRSLAKTEGHQAQIGDYGRSDPNRTPTVSQF